MASKNKLIALRALHGKGDLSDSELDGAGLTPEERQFVMTPAVRQADSDDSLSEGELLWEGMKAGAPELLYGAKQFGTRAAEKFIDPETVRQADIDANRYGPENKYDIMGEDPEKKLFGGKESIFPESMHINPYRAGKTVAQMAIPFSPSKATMLKKGLQGLKGRAKFGGKVGAVYGLALPTTESSTPGEYWAKKATGTGLGMAGGAVGGEIMNALLKGGSGAYRYSQKGVDIAKKLIQRIQGGKPLPRSLDELGGDMGRVSSELQRRIQSILDRANERGGKITPEEALKIAKYEDIGYPAGSQGAAKYPHEPLTPAQVTRDPYISQEEMLIQGHPAYKQKVANQANYMTGAVEKISEELQGAGTKAGTRYTGEAGYPSALEAGGGVAEVATRMKDRLTGRTEKIYSEATEQYGKSKVKPTGFLKAVKELEPDATAADITAIATGYDLMVRQAMRKQAQPRLGQKGTMERDKDMWASGFGHEKPPPPPKADSLSVASFEGIRKKLTRQSDQMKRQGNHEGAAVLRKLRAAMDADVEKAIGHDVYKAGRTTHQEGMQKLDIPVVNKILMGKYDDDFVKIVKNVEAMSYEQLLKLKRGMVSEGVTGKGAWRRLAAQIWHNMKEQGMHGWEGQGKGRLVSIPAIENGLKAFGKSARGLGANSEKGRLLFGDEMADKINDIIKLSKNLDIMGVGEVKTGWSAMTNLLDWGSRVLGKIPSVSGRATGNLMGGTAKVIRDVNKDKLKQQIVEKTMQGPIYAGMRDRKVGLGRLGSYVLPGGATRLGAIEANKRKRGLLGP